MKATIFFRINRRAPSNSARNRASAFSRDIGNFDRPCFAPAVAERPAVPRQGSEGAEPRGQVGVGVTARWAAPVSLGNVRSQQQVI